MFPYVQTLPLKPCCVQWAAVQHEGVQRLGNPTQLSFLHSDWSVHPASGDESRPPEFAGAHAHTKCAGEGEVISFTRHVVPVAQSDATQHVSMHLFVWQRPDRHSLLPLHAAPAALPPLAGGVRLAFAAGTQ